jgi:hypothetical protein
MNIMNISNTGISARLFAGITMLSLLLSALPVAFFVANAAPVNVFGPAAATVSTSTPYVSGSIDATGYTDLAFSFEYDIFALDDGDSFTYDVTVGGVSQGSGTIVGVDADTSVMTPVSVDLTAFPDATGVQLDITVSANTPSDVLEVQNIVLSGEPVIVTPTTVNITNLAELQSAIENQAPGQTWTIQGGDYGLDQSSNVLASGQTGWYFPIVEDDITINGVDNPVIYGDSYSANGAFPTQNLISVFGDNVTITGLTLMPKVQPNKTIEVLGEDFTLEDVVFKPNTKVDPALYDNITSVSDREFSREWGGSLYFSNEGAHVIKDVTIHNGGVSFSNGGVGAGTTIEFDNVQIVKETNNDFNNSYRYSSGFANSANSTIGLPQVTYRINQTLDNAVSVFANAKDGDTVEFDSDITTTQELAVITAVTINGNDFTISPDFTKDNTPGNNSALQVNVDSVTINNLNIDGSDGINLHGINTYKIVDLELNDVSLVNSDYSGLVVNGSEVKVSNITTAGNGWHGINVDLGGNVTNPARLVVTGVSSHNEPLNIYVDDTTEDVEVDDQEGQYNFTDSVLKPNDRNYVLTPETEVPLMANIKMYVERGGVYEESYVVRPGDNVRVEVEATDEGSGIEDVEFRIQSLDGQYVAALTFVDTPEQGNTYRFEYQVPTIGRYTNTHNPMNLDIDGHRFWARATDNAGNYHNGLSGNFTFDTVVPEMSNIVMFVERNGTYQEADVVEQGDNVRIEVDASDVASDIRDVEFRIQSQDGQYVAARTYIDTPVESNTYRFEYQVPADSRYINTHNLMNEIVDGHRFWARATDEVGNYNHGLSGDFTFSVDEAKPFMEVIEPEDGQVFTEDFDIVVHATDDLGLTQVVINLKDASGGNIGSCLNENAGGVTDYTTSCRVDVDSLSPGTYGFKANAKDTTGKISNTVSQSFEVQEEIPESVTITNPATATEVVSGEYEFTAEYIDNDNTPDNIQWAIRADNCTGSNDTVAGNVDGFSDDSTFVGSAFSTTLNTAEWLNGEYCFVVNPDEGPGEDDLRATQTFNVENNYTISGVKWDDANASGEIDEDESTLSGWTINLTQEGSEGSTVSTTTNDSGEFSFTVPAGTWTITEEPVSGWTQTGQYLNGEVVATGTQAFGSCTFVIPSDEEGQGGYTCSFGNQEDIEIITQTETPSGSGDGGGGGGGSSSTGTLIERVAQPTPMVLGITTDEPQFCPFLTEYLQIGADNSTMEVMKLQAFLNIFKDTFGGTENPMTGTFGTITDANVRAFQETYRSEILDPWAEGGIDLQPTGFVYLTTQWKINDIVCPGDVTFPNIGQ